MAAALDALVMAVVAQAMVAALRMDLAAAVHGPAAGTVVDGLAAASVAAVVTLADLVAVAMQVVVAAMLAEAATVVAVTGDSEDCID